MESNKHFSPLSVWAFSVGNSIGWGSFFITSTTYLPTAGHLGSIIGLFIGLFVMFFIAHNYHFLMNRFPSGGGGYSYTKEIFGADYGFLVATFLVLTYIAIFWANATSLSLFAHYFLGDFFRFCPLYTIFGYQIYLGEVLLTAFAILLTALITGTSRRVASFLIIALVFVFTLGILVIFAISLKNHGQTSFSFEPTFIPSKNELGQILKIAFISPWAFIGFESVSHFVPEFKFSSKKSGGILHISLITTTVLYALLIALSVTAYPPEYNSWFSYISDIENLNGIKGLPLFYAANFYMGKAGHYILMSSLFALIVTSLIGNICVLARLLRALADDEVISKKIAHLSNNKLPITAILLIAGISIFVPLLGRTAIGWIVDVTTIGSTIIYGFLSLATFKIAKKESHKVEVFTGLFGLILMIIFFASLIIPNFFTEGSLAPESYFLFSVWAIIGFFKFHSLLKNDTKRIYGKSNIVWICVLSLILLLTLIWMIQTDRKAVSQGIEQVQNYLQEIIDVHQISESKEAYLSLLLRLAFKNVYAANIKTTIILLIFFISVALTVISNTNIIRKRELEYEKEICATRIIAYTDPLTGVKSKNAYAEYEHKLNKEIEEKLSEDFSVVVCDVNNLKWVNDNLGHKAGDQYIKDACHLICTIFDHSPVFRTGGDEFVVILKGYDFEHKEELLAELNKISEENNGQNGKVVVSAGVSDFDQKNDEDYNEVFKRADTAMYKRKRELKEMLA